MLESLIRVCLRGDQSAPVKGQPLRSGISGAAALAALEKANGQGSLQDSSGVFVSIDDKNLAPGIYCFIPAEPAAREERSGISQEPDAKRRRQEAAVLDSLPDTLPSASVIASTPKEFRKFAEKCPIYMHRPLSNYTVPLTVMCPEFGHFQQAYHAALPESQDCKLAQRLCETASQIHVDEVNDLQPLIHELLCDSFPSYVIIGSKRADGQPNERIQFGQADIGSFELKTDSGGNTYGQCQQYYVTQVLALRAAASPILSHSCKPMLWCELSCASLRVCAAAFFNNCFAYEPLTPALHLFGINDPNHMLGLARCCCALRQTLAQLARLYKDLGSSQGLPERLLHASPSVPYHISHLYRGAEVKQIMRPTRLAFLVWPPNPSDPVIVKLIPDGADSDAAEVHAAWADVGIAPKQVQSDSLPHKWQAVVMEYLQPPDWMPLSALAPVRLQEPANDVLGPPLSLDAWDAAAHLTRDALTRAHQIRFPSASPDGLPTVHGDVRLPNILAHRAETGAVDMIKFVDFDWAGVEGKSRYPVIMNPDVRWPSGAGPQLLMRQDHDVQLLQAELERGRGVSR